MCVTKKEINLLDVYTFLHVRDSQIRCLPDNSMIMLTLFISCEEDVRERRVYKQCTQNNLIGFLKNLRD